MTPVAAPPAEAAPAPSTAEAVEVTAPATPARVVAVVAILVAVVGGLLGPTGRLDGILASPIRVLAGAVDRLVDGDWLPVEVGDGVPVGSTLRATGGSGAVAVLAMAGGRVHLADGTQVVAGTTVQVDLGAVLVEDADDLPVGDGVDSTRGSGTWRFDAAGRAGVYRGSAVVTDVAGREVLLRGYEEVRLRAGLVDGAARPYVYAAADPFDRARMADALAVDDLVAALARGLEADYGDEPQPIAFYTDFDGLDGALVGELGNLGFDRVDDTVAGVRTARVGPPAQVLVAAVVTEALAVDAGLDPAAAASEVRTLRQAGSTWGLIAQRRELDAGHVRAAADRALIRRLLQEQAGTAVPVVPPPPAPGPDVEDDPVPPPADPGPTTPPAPPPPPQGGGDPDPGDRPDPGDDGQPEDEPGLVEGLLDNAGVDEVVGGQAGEVVDEVVDVVDGLLDPVLNPGRQDPDLEGSTLDVVGNIVTRTAHGLGRVVGDLLGTGPDP